jgi:AraC family L-rhamnose operon regulatory protein RhaS
LVGITPMQYLIQCRLELGAARLLCYPLVHVTDTAFDCGFSSSQYFATAFTKLFGVSPREYRKAGAATRPIPVSRV